MEDKKDLNQVYAALCAPFPAQDIEWRAQTVTDRGMALMLPYITARAVMDRLDSAVGPLSWSDSLAYDVNGAICTLTVLGVTRTDVGPFTDVEPFKGAASDALKRAAVKFGIGRYLYNLPEFKIPFTAGYPERGQAHLTVSAKIGGQRTWGWVPMPTLPDWALPKGEQRLTPPTPPNRDLPAPDIRDAVRMAVAESKGQSPMANLPETYDDVPLAPPKVKPPYKPAGAEWCFKYKPPFGDPATAGLKAAKRVRWEPDSKCWLGKDLIHEWAGFACSVDTVNAHKAASGQGMQNASAPAATPATPTAVPGIRNNAPASDIPDMMDDDIPF